MRTCTKCKITLPPECYSPDIRNKTDGLQPMCKKCKNEARRGIPASEEQKQKRAQFYIKRIESAVFKTCKCCGKEKPKCDIIPRKNICTPCEAIKKTEGALRLRAAKKKWILQNPEKVKAHQKTRRQKRVPGDRESQRRWEKANRERINQKQRAWHHSNKEKAAAKKRKYVEKNRELVRLKHRLYKKANPELVRKDSRAYQIRKSHKHFPPEIVNLMILKGNVSAEIRKQTKPTHTT